MDRLNTALRQTCLAVSAGLFTGGVVTTIISQDYAFEVFTKAYFPSLIFYQFYILLTVIQNEKEARENIPLIIVDIAIFLLFAAHIIFFRENTSP